MALFDGISQRVVETSRLSVGVLERDGDSPTTPADRTVVLVHDVVGSSLLWQETMQDLPTDLRVVAVDLRGFGETENLPVDATRGLRDFSDDLKATMDALAITRAHLVGWGMGGGVAMQFALDHEPLSLTLQAPVSPYGFGGTRLDGTRLTDDDAGSGAGAVPAEFVQRLRDRDTSADAAASPRSVFRATYVAADYVSDQEDTWVEAMLTTSTADGNYPGDSVDSPHWPGFAAGDDGAANAMSPKYFNASGLVALAEKPPILWVRGTADAIISDASVCDTNHLGMTGAQPGWPGTTVAPAQLMVSQTRDVLDAYRRGGGEVTEITLSGVGHSPHLERPIPFRQELLRVIGYVGPGQHPAPPTEAIILRSAD